MSATHRIQDLDLAKYVEAVSEDGGMWTYHSYSNYIITIGKEPMSRGRFAWQMKQLSAELSALSTERTTVRLAKTIGIDTLPTGPRSPRTFTTYSIYLEYHGDDVQ